VSNAALWVRVSTLMQDETNQLPAMRQFAAHHGHTVKYTYRLNDVSAFKGEHHDVLKQVLDDAYRGEFKILVVWAIDRICREGPEEFLKLFRQLRERGVTLVSIQEPWLNNSDATTELLICFAAWAAKMESVRHSERVKIGLAKRRAKGLQVGGRQPGAKDRRPRKKRQRPIDSDTA
jgi:DNA invertase Pin-like site-specific DNA recombinase